MHLLFQLEGIVFFFYIHKGIWNFELTCLLFKISIILLVLLKKIYELCVKTYLQT